MKILIIKFRHIGDVLLSTPLIHNLRLLYPEARIDVAVNQDALPILKYNPDINHVYPYPREKNVSFFRKIRKETTYLKTLLSTRYDLVLNLTEGDRGAIYSLLSQAKIRVGIQTRNRLIQLMHPYTAYLTKLPESHTVESNLSLLSLLKESPKEKRLYMHHHPDDESKINRILAQNGIESFVIVHPVSRWMFKCWDDKKFAEIIDHLFEDFGCQVVITASPDPKELQKVAGILRLCRSNPIDLSGQLSLSELSALITRAKLFLGVDTAPMHMAAAHDIPVIGLFGASYPQIWGPWENTLQRGDYLFIDGMQRLGKHTVISRTDHTIFYRNGVKHSRGMDDIEIAEVIEALETYFTDRPTGSNSKD